MGKFTDNFNNFFKFTNNSFKQLLMLSGFISSLPSAALMTLLTVRVSDLAHFLTESKISFLYLYSAFCYSNYSSSSIDAPFFVPASQLNLSVNVLVCTAFIFIVRHSLILALMSLWGLMSHAFLSSFSSLVIGPSHSADSHSLTFPGPPLEFVLI